MGCDRIEHRLRRADPVQVETGQGEAGVGGMHVGVDECWGDQCAVELNHPVADGRVVFLAEPGDPSVHDEQGGRAGAGGTVYVPAPI